MKWVNRTNNSKILHVRVYTYETDLEFQLSLKATGKSLFDMVCSSIDLQETTFFGLENYFNNANGQMEFTTWLKMEKKICTQKLTYSPLKQLRFLLHPRFFPEDFERELIQPLTRHLFYLDVKNTLFRQQSARISNNNGVNLEGGNHQNMINLGMEREKSGLNSPNVQDKLSEEGQIDLDDGGSSSRSNPPSDVAILLASLSAQAEYGDLGEAEVQDEEDHMFLPGRMLQLLPSGLLMQCQLSQEVCRRFRQCYKSHKSMTKEDAELAYLKIAHLYRLFGIEYFMVTDKMNCTSWLGVSAEGLSIYPLENKTQAIHSYSWKSIKNVSYKDKKFTIKLTSPPCPSLHQTTTPGTCCVQPNSSTTPHNYNNHSHQQHSRHNSSSTPAGCVDPSLMSSFSMSTHLSVPPGIPPVTTNKLLGAPISPSTASTSGGAGGLNSHSLPFDLILKTVSGKPTEQLSGVSRVNLEATTSSSSNNNAATITTAPSSCTTATSSSTAAPIAAATITTTTTTSVLPLQTPHVSSITDMTSTTRPPCHLHQLIVGKLEVWLQTNQQAKLLMKLCRGNSDFFMKRRQPESREIQQMRLKARTERARRFTEEARLNRANAEKQAALEAKAVLEEKVAELEAALESCKTAGQLLAEKARYAQQEAALHEEQVAELTRCCLEQHQRHQNQHQDTRTKNHTPSTDRLLSGGSGVPTEAQKQPMINSSLPSLRVSSQGGQTGLVANTNNQIQQTVGLPIMSVVPGSHRQPGTDPIPRRMISIPPQLAAQIQPQSIDNVQQLVSTTNTTAGFPLNSANSFGTNLQHQSIRVASENCSVQELETELQREKARFGVLQSRFLSELREAYLQLESVHGVGPRRIMCCPPPPSQQQPTPPALTKQLVAPGMRPNHVIDDEDTGSIFRHAPAFQSPLAAAMAGCRGEYLLNSQVGMMNPELIYPGALPITSTASGGFCAPPSYPYDSTIYHHAIGHTPADITPPYHRHFIDDEFPGARMAPGTVAMPITNNPMMPRLHGYGSLATVDTSISQQQHTWTNDTPMMRKRVLGPLPQNYEMGGYMVNTTS